MGQIKVTPEQLEKAAKTVRDAKQVFEHIYIDLRNQADYICSQWTGFASVSFHHMINDFSPQFYNITQTLESLGDGLEKTAIGFRNADKLDSIVDQKRLQNKIGYLKVTKDGAKNNRFGRKLDDTKLDATSAIGTATGSHKTNMIDSIADQKRSKNKVEYLKGSIERSKKNRLGGKLEGTILDATTGIGKGISINNKLLTGNLEANFGKNIDAITEDISTGGLFGFKAEASYLESNINKNEFIGNKTTVTQKFQNISSAFGIDEYTFKADASYTAHKYEFVLNKIDIPNITPYFRENDITIRFEIGVGNVGAKIHAGAENGMYTSLYKDFAFGFFAKPEKKE